MSDTALILIDIQNDYFKDGRWPVENMLEVSANAARLLQHARNKAHSVIHIRHENPSVDAPFFRPGTQGAVVHSSVSPENNEPVILKHRPNSFLGTDLRQQLDDRSTKNIVICGALSQMCVDSTARTAVDFGYAVTIIENACGAKEQTFDGRELSAAQVHAAFMAPLAMSFARVTTCEIFLSENIQPH